MVRRIIESIFWEDEKVVDHFSPEDKYFMMYLLTNPRTTSIGIYKFPKKIVAFELGYTQDSVNVLLDRFEHKYNLISYDSETQEIAVLNSLKYNISKGGKPIEQMVEREIKSVKGDRLILATYQKMSEWWSKSDRAIDGAIKSIFENELFKRKVPKENNTNTNANTNADANTDYGYPIRGRIVDVSEKTSVSAEISDFYQQEIGILSPSQFEQLIDYINLDGMEVEVIKKAITKSADNSKRTFSYINSILRNWKNNGIKTIVQVEEEQREFESKKQTGMTDKEREDLKQPDEFYGF